MPAAAANAPVQSPSSGGAWSTPPAGAPLLLEFSTEVCHQVGGIYQVLRSKAPSMLARWGERYLLVGPYSASAAALEFEPRAPIGLMARLVETLEHEGIRAHFGQWLVQGRPQVLLLEHALSPQRLDETKFLLWKNHRIETPAGDSSIDTAVSFAQAALKVLRAASVIWAGEVRSGPQRVVAHFHEWLGGLAIPAVRLENLPVACVFTTHATLLGRYMASCEDDFYETLSSRNHEEGAARYNVRPQHYIERACAHGAHVFSTVSAITGEECESLLGRRPDILLPNGINLERYDVPHHFQMLHSQYKERISRFVMGYFFPSYTFDLERTLYFFTSGRFEPHNKGFDLALEAMARLNAQLKAFDLRTTVVFFVVTRRPTRSINPMSLQSRGVLNELESVCARILDDVGLRLFPRAAMGERVRLDEMVEQYWALRYRRVQQAFRVTSLPPVVTHILEDDANDPVLNQIRNLGLLNRADDPVKIVYHPDFINPASPFWGIEYDQFVRGCHLGVFPSAYEPWGYTPLECVASGVPAITSDLAGFGRYVAEKYPEHDRWGLTVLKRRGRPYHAAAADLARWMLAFCRLDRRGRIDLRNEVERHAGEFDWTRLARAYHQAHDLALQRSRPAVAGV